MATLIEIAELPSNPGWDGLVEQVRAACVKKAAAIISETTPGDGAKNWAISTLSDPSAVARQIVFAIVGLADNASESVPTSAILGASESQIQSYVDQAVDKLYGV